MYVWYVDMFMKEIAHLLNVQSVMLQLLSSKHRQVIKYGLLNTL